MVEIGWTGPRTSCSLQVEADQVQCGTCRFLRPLMMTYWLLWSSSNVMLIQSVEGNI